MIIDLHSGFPPGKDYCPLRWRNVYRVVWWIAIVMAAFLLTKYWHVIEDAALGSSAHGTEISAPSGTSETDVGTDRLYASTKSGRCE